MARSPFDLSGRVALVTGASRGLGFGLARGLAEAGASVVLNGRDRARLDAAVASLRAAGLAAHAAAFDVCHAAAVGTAVAEVERSVGPIDILVNNAGIQHRHPTDSMPEAAWREVIDTNLTAPFLVAQAVARGMVARRRGKIINVTSILSEVARPTIAPYNAAKGGLRQLTRTMAVEWARHNIQVNAIGPGFFRTEMTEPLANDPRFDAFIQQRVPAGRWGEPHDLAGTVVYLASAASDFVTGQTVYVDGGLLSSV